MGLTARQHRALESIEKRLRAREPGLFSMFSLFTRLTQDEAIPATEAVRIGRWRYLTGGLKMPKARRVPVARLVGLALAPFILISLISAALAVGGVGATRSLCTAPAFHFAVMAAPQPGCTARLSQSHRQQ